MDYTPVYEKYNGELRPLISEFEGREEQFEEPILKSMAYVVDELSLCVQSKNLDTQNSHLKKTLQYLDEAVTNSYKYLVFSHHRRLKKFKRRFSKYQMQQFDNGKFVGKFYNASKEAMKCVKRARKQDALMDAKMGFKQAYDLYSVIEHDISDFESEGAAMVSRGKGIIGSIVKIVLSVAVSVAVAYCLSI